MTCSCPSVPYIGPSLGDLCYGGTYVVFLALLDSLIREDCSITEMCQRITPTVQPDDSYDFVVLGGGPAGATAAARLSENPAWKVLLVEAGNDEPPGSQIPSMLGNFIGRPGLDWGYSTEPQENACLANNGTCRWVRAKILGGCGVINGMMYMRGVPKDYDNWEKLGNEEWGWKEVLPYFLMSENNQQIGTLVDGELHAEGGPMSVMRFNDAPVLAADVLKAAKELGFEVVDDINNGNFSGFAIAQAAALDGTRVSAARAFLRPARNRTNLHIMLNSTATRVIIDDTKKISAVEFIYNNTTYTVNVTREAIISGGAINSPQILLLSGIGPKEELDKVNIEQVHDLPGVGQNLHNHVAFNLNINLNLLNNTNDLDWMQAYKYLNYKEGPLSSTGMAQTTGRLTTKYGDPEGDNPDLQFFMGGFSATCCRTCTVGELANPDNPEAPKIFQISSVNIKPKSRGYIGLHTNDPLDPPLMDPNYLGESDDVKILIEGVRVVQRLVNTSILQDKYGAEIVKSDYGSCADDHTYDSDEFWECAIRYATGPENHQAGSCKMGPESDPLAVVDSTLQVHGIEGLRVMDASVMPVVVSGNTHATVVMIGEKGADYIKKKWEKKIS